MRRVSTEDLASGSLFLELKTLLAKATTLCSLVELCLLRRKKKKKKKRKKLECSVEAIEMTKNSKGKCYDALFRFQPDLVIKPAWS